jgi:hypothetical protein
MELETTAVPPLASPSPTFAPQLSTGALIQRSLSIWWKNLLRFAGFSLILFIPVVLVVGVMAAVVAWQAFSRGGEGLGASEISLLVGIGIIAIPLLIVATVAQVGGITYSAVQQLAGRPVRFGAMFSASFKRFFPLLGAGILAVLIIWGGFLLLIVPGVIFACALAPAIPAVMAERLGPVEAIRRSWALTRGHRASILLAALVLFLIQFGINLVAAVLGIVPILGQLAGIAIQLCAMSLSLTLPAVAYHDLRVLKEATPTEELARVFE